MNLKSSRIGGLSCVLAGACLSLWARTRLPDAPMATHFDLQGQANGYMPRDVELMCGPALILAVWVVLWLLPAVSPRKALLDRSAPAYGTISLAILLFILLAHALIIGAALSLGFDLLRVLNGGMGVLFVVIGNFLPKIRFNYFMGIRTPWTLSDERVWDKTHRAAGLWFVLGGLTVLGATFVVPESLLVATMLVCILVPTLVSLVYSYLAARQLKLV